MTIGYGSNGTTYPDVLYRLIQENITERIDLTIALNTDVQNINLSVLSQLADEKEKKLKVPSVIKMGIGGETTIPYWAEMERFHLSRHTFLLFQRTQNQYKFYCS